MRGLRVGVLAGILASGALPAKAATSWFEVKSPHFTVITNSGEREGRKTAWQFEQIRQALKIAWPWAQMEGGGTFLIFAVRDENTLKSLGPQYWEGKQYRPTSFWTSTRDREYVALRTDLPDPSDASSNPYRDAYFAYVSMVLNRSLPSGAPAWYRRGLAEVMSNTIVRDKELHVGRLMQNHLQRVRDGSLIPLGEFLAADRDSKWLNREAEAWQFDAQSWAFVHCLMFANEGAHRGRVEGFNRLLLQGTAADVAMREAFGPDMTPYFAEMKVYVTRSVFQYSRAMVDAKVKAEGFVTTPLAPSAAAVLRGEMLVALRQPVEARAAAAEARALDPASPGPDEIEAALLDREEKADEAKAAYARAVERGSKRGFVYFRLAELEVGYNPGTDALRARGVGLLAKANELEPSFANGFSYHAQLLSDMNQLDRAIELVTAAVKLEPRETYHRMVAARALWNGGDKDRAIKTAGVGLQMASNEGQRADAQRFIDFATSSQPPRPRGSTPAGPTATTPTASSTTSAGGQPASPGIAPAPAPAPVRLAGGDDVSSCFSERSDAACARAVPMLEQSCAAKEAMACRSLGSLHDGGFGIAVSKAKAAAAYDAGCTHGDKSSCARYAVLQIQGFAVPRGNTSGVATLEKLCGETVEDACVGWALVLGSRGDGIDARKARNLLAASCDRSHATACELLKKMPAPR